MNEHSITKTDKERFFSKILVNLGSGCHEWQGSFTYGGYGRFYWNNKTVSAHRFCYILNKGTIPPELCVCHSCDNKKCVNIDHLWIGTHQDNALDRNAKGRDNHRPAKLTAKQEIEIAIAYYTTDVTQEKLASKYEVKRTTINRIIRLSKFRNQYGYKTIRKSKIISPAMRTEIKKRRTIEGLTVSQLAHIYQVSEGAIQYHLDIKKYRKNCNKAQRERRRRKLLVIQPLS